MKERIKEHGAQLNEIFHTKLDDAALVKKLRGIEKSIYAVALDYCNGLYNSKPEVVDEKIKAAEDKLEALLKFKEQKIPVVINMDPRGYALKIDEAWVGEHKIVSPNKDFGGYLLLAPDLSE